VDLSFSGYIKDKCVRGFGILQAARALAQVEQLRAELDVAQSAAESANASAEIARREAETARASEDQRAKRFNHVQVRRWSTSYYCSTLHITIQRLISPSNTWYYRPTLDITLHVGKMLNVEANV
jgi:hypothetical protein